MSRLSRLSRVLLVLALVAVSTASRPQAAQATTVVPGPCLEGTLPHGALSLVCVPSSGWNGDLVVFAHGYVAFDQPLGFYHLTLPDGTPLSTIVQSLGFAFATTSYRTNGLVVLDGIDDLRELVRAFGRSAPHAPANTYLVGVSEGGLVVTLAIERSPDMYAGALAACGPIASFKAQIDYVGDFRVLFDYFFPGVIPGSPIEIPAAVIRDWDQIYLPRVISAMTARPGAALELAAVAKLPLDWADPTASVVSGALGVLWYNVFGTNDAIAKLRANPYSNIGRWYSGSSNDALLNVTVGRFAKSDRAVAHLSRYETSGQLTRKIVSLHTLGDPIVPFWHEIGYYWKAATAGTTDFFTPIPTARYGHCNFTAPELLGAFALLISAGPNIQSR